MCMYQPVYTPSQMHEWMLWQQHYKHIPKTWWRTRCWRFCGSGDGCRLYLLRLHLYGEYKYILTIQWRIMKWAVGLHTLLQLSTIPCNLCITPINTNIPQCACSYPIFDRSDEHICSTSQQHTFPSEIGVKDVRELLHQCIGYLNGAGHSSACSSSICMITTENGALWYSCSYE